ncbi:MAG: CHAT domain-containing protein [Gracilimonas sp.]|uniref:CHAT domain-containing protein n=1 Tax=Gracilimonas sp. TaxID=1974203 RepID=UPI0019AF1966|nr:CHAT domain-containing protein [Gracilimonas sp.]MBD3617123.1 CHAT domain-containing protein [Gracilimonas sp.]
MKNVLTITFLITFGFGQILNAQVSQGDSLFVLGNESYSDRDYARAAEHYQKAIDLFLQKSDSLKWMEASFEYAKTLYVSGSVNEALEIFRTLDKTPLQQIPTSLQINIKNYIGLILRRSEQYDESQKFYLDALKVAEGITDSSLIARLNNNISYTYQNTGDYETALFHQQKAKEIYTDLNNDARLSYVLNGIFLTMMELGLHQQAEPYIRKSLKIREKLEDPRLLDIAYHNLAWNFERQGKRDSAIIYYQKSLELSRMLENPYDITQTLENIGSLFDRSGDFETALSYYNEALAINREINRPVSTADGLVRIARIAIRNNDLENATAFYNEALEWMQEVNDPKILSNLYLDIANLELLKGNYGVAKEFVSNAHDIAFEKQFQLRQVRSHNLLAKLYKIEGDLQNSLKEYKKAYKLSSSSSIPSRISPSMNLAKAYNEVSSDSAFIIAEETFSLIDSIRTNVAGLTFRSGFFRKHAGFYNEVASWYINRKNNPKKAFELIESAKARVLMDELAEDRENELASLDEPTLIKKQQKAKQLDRLYNQLEVAKSVHEKNSLRDELKDLEFEYQAFLNQIQTSNAHLKDFKYPQPVTLKQAQVMLDSETAILEYAFTENSLIRLFITRTGISGSVFTPNDPLTANQYFTEQIRGYREAITNKDPMNKIAKLGAGLYNELIPGLELNNDTKITNLLIIPGGALTFLPFESLSNNKRFLIEDLHIKYLPSASIYSFINNPHRTTSFELLALAGSGFEGGSNASPSSSQASFASLPSTLLEVDSISVNFTNLKVLKNEDVTEAALKSHELGDFRFIHFATHAEVNEENPARSGLLLSKKTEMESLFGEDGYLNSREISGLRLNADLVTLSACNTGMGKIVTGEGLLGLQRSFLSAGASSVMVSLWSVFDRSTSVFMSTFYKQMLAHEQEDYGLWNQTLDWFGMYEHPLFDYKAKALRDAKLYMIDHPYYKHPVYWAPFILIGK